MINHIGYPHLWNPPYAKTIVYAYVLLFHEPLQVDPSSIPAPGHWSTLPWCRWTVYGSTKPLQGPAAATCSWRGRSHHMEMIYGKISLDRDPSLGRSEFFFWKYKENIEDEYMNSKFNFQVLASYTHGSSDFPLKWVTGVSFPASYKLCWQSHIIR